MITQAAERLKDVAIQTPLLESPLLNNALGFRLLIKPECLQKTGSFKIRGAYNKIASLDETQRKAGVESLDDLLKAKNKRHVAQHFTRLAKEYNDRQMIEEATLVSQFWAETSAAFEGDDSGLFTYMLEWNRHYAGRGIPKLLDTDLI